MAAIGIEERITIVQKINQKHAVFALLIGIYSSMVFSFNYAGLKSFDLSSESRIAAEILKIEQSFNGYGVQWALIALALALFFYLFFEWRVKTGQRVKAGLSCISVVFGFFNTFGLMMYYRDQIPAFNSNNAFVLTVFLAFGYGLVFYAIAEFLIENIGDLSFAHTEEKFPMSKWRTFFERHLFFMSFIIILMCWLLWIISYYPASADNDVFWQMSTYFGYDHFVPSNHHPWFSTLVITWFYQIGMKLHNENLGLFLYVFCRDVLMAAMLAHGIKILKQNGIRFSLCILVLLFFAITPVWGAYAKHAFKDTFAYGLFSYAILNLIILTMNLKKNIFSCRQGIVAAIALLLSCLFRNNFVYALLPTVIFLAIFALYKKKTWAILLLVLPFIVFWGFQKYIHYTGVKPSEKQEAMSLPLQQTARTVKKYHETLPLKYRKQVEQFFQKKDFYKRYDPICSDPIKNNFRGSGRKYLRLWFEMSRQYPKMYCEAGIGLSSGYYAFIPQFPTGAGNWNSGMTIFNWLGGITDKHYHVYTNKSFQKEREILDAYSKCWDKVPLLSLTDVCAFYTWLIILLCYDLIRRRKWVMVVPCIALVLLIGTCMMSPINNCFRYYAPIAASCPWLLLLVPQNNRKVS